MLKCDLHIHTSFSPDGESSVEEIVARAIDAGLDAIAVTDHDTVDGAAYALEYVEKNNINLIIIPGIEISTKHGHLLALGIREVIPPKMDFAKSVDAARKAGAVLILPHPYHQFRHGAALKYSGAIGLVDAVESFNSRYIFGTANRKAARKAKKYGKPCVAGSDAHNCRFVGYGTTLIDTDDRSVSGILAAIKECKTTPTGKMTPLRTYTKQSMKNTKRRILRHMHMPRRRIRT